MPSVSLTVAVGAPETITTGAVMVEANPEVQLYHITTGGTGGQEIINLLEPDLPIEAAYNSELVQRRVMFVLTTITNPADEVVIRPRGVSGASVKLFSDQQWGSTNITNVSMSWLGAAVCYVWAYEGWTVDAVLTNYNFDHDPVTAAVRLQGLPTTNPVSAGQLWNDAGTLKISAG